MFISPILLFRNENLGKVNIIYKDKEILSGIIMNVWSKGNSVTLSLSGSTSAAITAGAKNLFFELPKEYCPQVQFTNICQTQYGKRFIMTISHGNHNIQFYYVLDAISSGDNIYGYITWTIGDPS
jgi:hypothetical protein